MKRHHAWAVSTGKTADEVTMDLHLAGLATPVQVKVGPSVARQVAASLVKMADEVDPEGAP